MISLSWTMLILMASYSRVSSYTTSTATSISRPCAYLCDGNNNAVTSMRRRTRQSLTNAPSNIALSGHSKSQTLDSSSNSNSKKSIHVPWMIVGGGIHGVHIATRLLGSESAGINPEDLCIIDGNQHLLQKWKSRTTNTGMEYLRSSANYHLDINENSLRSQVKFGSDNHHANYKSSGAIQSLATKQIQTRKSRKRRNWKSQKAFSNDYERPRLDVFNQHCDSVIAKYELDQLHRQGFVTAIEPSDDHVRVEVMMIPSSTMTTSTSNSSPAARTSQQQINNDNKIIYTVENIVLALGNDDPSYAAWVDKEDIESGLVRHLLDDEHFISHKNDPRILADTPVGIDATKTKTVIVGGGISAVHKALELAHANASTSTTSSAGVQQTKEIHLISRHPLREQQFDTHQEWMMDRAAAKRSLEGGGYGIPKRQRMFSKSSCWKERRMIIAKERIPGTVTPAVNRGNNGLRYAIENGHIHWHQAEILEKKILLEEHQKTCTNTDSKNCKTCMELSLSTGEKIQVDEILLATGFGKKLPGGKIINEDLIQKAGLKVSDFCGFPIVDENLCWHPRIFVAGALAELELGPSARNIAGARLAAERILQVANSNKTM